MKGKKGNICEKINTRKTRIIIDTMKGGKEKRQTGRKKRKKKRILEVMKRKKGKDT